MMSNHVALKYFEEFGLEILDTPRDSRGKRIYTLRYPCGHIFTSSFQYHKRRGECKECNPPKNSRKTKDQIELVVKGKGFTLLENYKEGGLIKLKVLCENKHEWDVYFSNFQKEHRSCPYCNKKQARKMFFYLQQVQQGSLTFLKYGITKNWPEYRKNRQSTSSGMVHEITDFVTIESKRAIDLEGYLRKTLPYHDFGFKFDGYTETVSVIYEEFLRKFILNSIVYEGNMEEYLAYIGR